MLAKVALSVSCFITVFLLTTLAFFLLTSDVGVRSIYREESGNEDNYRSMMVCFDVNENANCFAIINRKEW